MISDAGFVGGADYTLLEGDCFAALGDLADDSVQLTFTSPPYNIGKAYETRRAMSDYLEPYGAFLKTLYAKTSPGGSICWQVGTHVHGRSVVPLKFEFYPLLLEAGFRLRNELIWCYGHGANQTQRLSGRHETVLWLAKSDDYTFNLDDIRVPQLYAGKKAYKGPNKGKLSSNPLGKNPSDVWVLMREESETGIIDIPQVKNAHPEKTTHPCQFPVELPERFILALTNPGDLVLDPFLGSGSTAIAALKQNRNFLGIEQDANYLAIGADRIRQLQAGTLKTRTLGTRVQRPAA